MSETPCSCGGTTLHDALKYLEWSRLGDALDMNDGARPKDQEA